MFAVMAEPNGIGRMAQPSSVTETVWDGPALPSVGGGVAGLAQTNGPEKTVTEALAGPPVGFARVIRSAGTAVAAERRVRKVAKVWWWMSVVELWMRFELETYERLHIEFFLI
jgi:hypothetical protein